MQDAVFFLIAFFLIPAVTLLLIVWFTSVTKRKRYELQAKMYAKAFENGQPVPTDLFAEPKTQKKFKPLNTGFVCMSIGIGIALACLVIAGIAGNTGGEDMATAFKVFASIGIIPFFIGVAFVIIYFIEKRKNAAENAQ